MVFEKSLDLSRDLWSFQSPDPTSVGERGTYVTLTCLNGETIATLAALIGGYVNPLFPFLGFTWYFQDLCHAFLSSTFQDDSTCGFRFPNLVESSNDAAPYNISYDVANTPTNPLATSYYADLSIDGPDPSTIEPYDCCSFCPIPKKDLVLTYVINPLCGSGSGSFSIPLVYDGNLNKWDAATFAYQCNGRSLANYNFTFSLSCAGGLVLTISGPANFSCTFYNNGSTCDPLHLFYTPFGDTPCPIASSVFTSVFIDE